MALVHRRLLRRGGPGDGDAARRPGCGEHERRSSNGEQQHGCRIEQDPVAVATAYFAGLGSDEDKAAFLEKLRNAGVE